MKQWIFSILILAIIIFSGCALPGDDPVNPQEPPAEKEITQFRFVSPPVYGDINQENGTIDVQVPAGTDITSLEPIITFEGKELSPASSEVQNFSSSVTYTVTAEDDMIKTYEISVSVADISTPVYIVSFDSQEANVTCNPQSIYVVGTDNTLIAMPTDPSPATLETAQMLIAAHELDMAEKDLLELRSCRPDDARVAVALAKLHQRRGRRSESLRMYRVAAGLDGSSLEALVGES